MDDRTLRYVVGMSENGMKLSCCFLHHPALRLACVEQISTRITVQVVGAGCGSPGSAIRCVREHHASYTKPLPSRAATTGPNTSMSLWAQEVSVSVATGDYRA
jgi:hypothetical protein